jgi:hypothetical protein
LIIGPASSLDFDSSINPAIARLSQEKQALVLIFQSVLILAVHHSQWLRGTSTGCGGSGRTFLAHQNAPKKERSTFSSHETSARALVPTRNNKKSVNSLLGNRKPIN